MREAQILKDALWASRRRKIIVFLSAVLVLVTLLGTVVYIIEDAEAGFTSIPMSIYWAIVTVTTVGYGDIAHTVKHTHVWASMSVASLMMILGYAIIAVPTMALSERNSPAQIQVDTKPDQACPGCGRRRARRRCRPLQTLRPQTLNANTLPNWVAARLLWFRGRCVFWTPKRSAAMRKTPES